jgi:protein SCO1/2
MSLLERPPLSTPHASPALHRIDGRSGRCTRRAACVAMLGAPALPGCAPKEAPAAHGLDITGATYGLDFHLDDTQGRPRSLADFRGKVVLLFFGFVQCPDVCPAALARAAEVMQLLGDDGSKVQTLFITVDPERDTPETLQAYTAAFHPSFIGLRGDLLRTKETADHFKVYYHKVPTAGSYTIEHTAMIYAFDPAGRLRLALRPELSAKDVAQDVGALLQAAAGAGAGSAAGR